MTKVRVAVAAIVTALAIALACAGRSESDGSAERIAELEARVARLESELAATRGQLRADAGPDAPAGVMTKPIAKRYTPDVLDAGPDAVFSPEQVEAQCLERMPERCSVEAAGKLRARAQASGKREWVKVENQPADATAEGRACLAREKLACARAAQHQRKELGRFAWLDAQLTSARIDHEFSAQLAARLRSIGAQRGQVQCTSQFCRVEAAFGDRAVSFIFQLTDGGGGSVSSFAHGRFAYISRPGYDLPQ